MSSWSDLKLEPKPQMSGQKTGRNSKMRCNMKYQIIRTYQLSCLWPSKIHPWEASSCNNWPKPEHCKWTTFELWRNSPWPHWHWCRSCRPSLFECFSGLNKDQWSRETSPDCGQARVPWSGNLISSNTYSLSHVYGFMRWGMGNTCISKATHKFYIKYVKSYLILWGITSLMSEWLKWIFANKSKIGKFFSLKYAYMTNLSDSTCPVLTSPQDPVLTTAVLYRKGPQMPGW